ncbi:glycoside hydrolase family 65 protein [Metarhizium guizhouense ARSEF 977]|uniref:Glycoside hydrolase family 65 protein n=1 Tax=Metarhizium guizhouense (strain ARSEF 977) TaxID=1276136 RepID=A0A0B4GZB0_METGA|nr:glycoside hydrolase family 65 protein [Metarhizium guizhouense ARSEF 977]
MTYSIYAINNAHSLSGCAAYTWTLNSMIPYLRAPFYQFSEVLVDDTGLHPAFPFLTGHGGSNQIVPFGFLGVRTDNGELVINPSLPPQNPHVAVRLFYFGGAGLNAVMSRTHTVLTRFASDSLPLIMDEWAGSSMPVVSITVPNRLYFENNTYTGNMIQCMPAYSLNSRVQASPPESAVDGATSTAWQPPSDETASRLINMSNAGYQQVKGVYLNWADRPALNVTVTLRNDTLDGDGRVITILSITTGNWESEEVIVPYLRRTCCRDADIISGRLVRLGITGCSKADGQGATVAKFALIAA